MRYYVTIDGVEVVVALDGDQARVGDRTFLAHLRAVPGTPLCQLQLGQQHRAVVLERAPEGGWLVQLDGVRHEAQVLDQRTRHMQGLTRQGERRGGAVALRAPMPGLVVRILAQSGQRVAAGQPLVVLEAMKMENELRAGSAGVIREILVAPGQAVEKGQRLIELSEVPIP